MAFKRTIGVKKPTLLPLEVQIQLEREKQEKEEQEQLLLTEQQRQESCFDIGAVKFREARDNKLSIEGIDSDDSETLELIDR